jgi:hypothetical protein
MTAVATHLVMSFAQTLMHYKLGHHPMGGKFFRNHINFHHAHYSKDHLVSRTYLGDEGNNTPFFFIPDAAQTQANGTLRTGGPGRFPPFETDVGIEVSMTLHESNHGTQNGKNGPVH